MESRRNRSPALGQHALVIGASMAGLLSARVLADHFESVTVLERDLLPEGPEARKGVPQGRHTHALLQAGADAIEQLFPGFWQELLAEGSTCMDTSKDWLWFHHGVWKARLGGAPFMYGQTRPFLEHFTRQRLMRDYPQVRLVVGDVASLVHDGARGQVTGVRLRGEQERVLEADLVVDASGRGTRTPRWLEELGYGRAPEEHVHMDVCYATRLVEPPPEARDWKVLMVYGQAPNQKRMGYIFPAEGGRWLVTLGGYHGDHPPADDAGFLEFSHGLSRPEHYNMLRQARPLTPISLYKVPSSQRYYYERMGRFPEGLVVVGDAICSFNPIFGQGMTTAALGALTLGECLAGCAPGQVKGLARTFQRRTTRYNDVAWFFATSEDMRYPETEGKRPLGLGLLHWYTAQLMQLCSVDPEVHKRFLQVLHMKAGMPALLSPGMIFKALKWGLSPRGTRAPVAEAPPSYAA